eukprot:GHVR01008510.1.p1 GENE.GHVR01008510.1~~GHVR01008510.1.p1  ORF type:complete len:173 (+),score=32.83 GHVR01008510.1:44-562(+)
MNEILKGLWLGGLTDASDNEKLNEKGISYIVNCCTYGEYPLWEHFDGISYFRVNVEDTSRETISLYFEDVCEFIDDALSISERVLVHCRSGVSRSVTVMISYLMSKRLFGLQEAFFHVLAKRKIVAPNIGFMQQLCDFEEQLYEKNTVCLFKYTDWYTSDMSNRAAIPDFDP